MFQEPHIDRYELPCPRLPAGFDGLSILHLTDLHITRWTRRLAAWEKALAGLSPDLLAVTGDLGHRAWLWRRSLPSVVRLLDAVEPRLGTFFILGNHDALKLGAAIEETGRRLLENEAVFFEPAGRREAKAGDGKHVDGKVAKHVNGRPLDGKVAENGRATEGGRMEGGGRVAVIGLNQHRRIDTDIPMAMREVRPGDFKLMLLHYPDLIFEASAAGADVCLAGHTHGGQICWPDGRPIIRHDALPHAMCTGVHKVEGTWMVVNRGIGVAGIRMRLFCPPQAILLTLRAVPKTVEAVKLKPRGQKASGRTHHGLKPPV